jgi:TolA-binding protein
MKAQERHHLKQNELAIQTQRMVQRFAGSRNQIIGIAAAVIVLVAGIWGYFYFRGRTNDRVSAMLGSALQVQSSPIVPAPTVPGATQAPGTYPNETARAEAAIAEFQKVIDAYPSHEGGIAARYHRASVLLSLDRGADAEKGFADAIASGGASIYAEMAKMGRAQALVAQKKFDDAIRELTDLSGRRDGPLPIDGVLMELARTSRKAGKSQEARAAFRRVVDEFPNSTYANEARQQLATMGT